MLEGAYRAGQRSFVRRFALGSEVNTVWCFCLELKVCYHRVSEYLKLKRYEEAGADQRRYGRSPCSKAVHEL